MYTIIWALAEWYLGFVLTFQKKGYSSWTVLAIRHLARASAAPNSPLPTDHSAGRGRGIYRVGIYICTKVL